MGLLPRRETKMASTANILFTTDTITNEREQFEGWLQARGAGLRKPGESERAHEVPSFLWEAYCDESTAYDDLDASLDVCRCGKVGPLHTMITGDGECLCEECAAEERLTNEE